GRDQRDRHGHQRFPPGGAALDQADRHGDGGHDGHVGGHGLPGAGDEQPAEGGHHDEGEYRRGGGLHVFGTRGQRTGHGEQAGQGHESDDEQQQVPDRRTGNCGQQRRVLGEGQTDQPDPHEQHHLPQRQDRRTDNLAHEQLSQRDGGGEDLHDPRLLLLDHTVGDGVAEQDRGQIEQERKDEPGDVLHRRVGTAFRVEQSLVDHGAGGELVDGGAGGGRVLLERVGGHGGADHAGDRGVDRIRPDERPLPGSADE